MKRRLLIIAVCLLLGAVVNVAVAWGLAIRPAERCSPQAYHWCAGDPSSPAARRLEAHPLGGETRR